VLDLAGFKLTKIGTNQVSVVGGSITSGNIEISQGLFSIESGATCTGSGTITVDAGATLGTRGAGSGSLTRAIALNGGTIRNAGADSASVDSAITLGGNSTLDSNSRVTTLSGIISESGGSFGLTKIGTSNFVFGAANTYSGPTTINAGTLVLAAAGSIVDSS